MSLFNLMVHTFDHYQPVYNQDNSAGYVRYFALANQSVPCNWQPATSADNKDHNIEQEQESGSLFLLDAAVFAAVVIQDVIKVGGVRYRVKGKKNLCNLARVYSIELKEDLSGLFNLPPVTGSGGFKVGGVAVHN